MHITRIGGRNVKGSTFDEQVGPVTMIVGNNYSGKTARLDAIKLALLGQIPTLGAQVSRTFEEAGEGTEMKAGVTFNDGRQVLRSWKKSGERVTQDIDGEDFSGLPPVLLNVQSYFDLSVEKRTQFVFSSRKLAGTFDASALCAELRQLHGDPHTKAKETALWAITELVIASANKNTAPAPEWLAAIIGETQTMLQTARAEAQRMQKTVTGMTQLAANDISSLDAASVEMRIKEVNDQVTSIMADHRNAAVKVEKAKAGLARARELKLALLEAEGVDRLIIEATEEVAKLSPVITSYVSGVGDAYREVTLAQNKVNDASKQHAAFVSDNQKMEVTRARCLADLSNSISETARLQDQIETLNTRYKANMASPVCPTCGQASDHWSAVLAKNHDFEVGKLREQLTNATHRKTMLECQREALTTSLAETGKLVQNANSRAVEAQANVATAQQDYSLCQQSDKAHAERKARIDYLNSKLLEYERKRSQVKGWTSELAAIGAESVEDLQKQADAIRAKAAPLYLQLESDQTLLKRIVAAKQDEFRRRQAIEEAERSDAAVEMTKLALEKMKEYRDKLVADGFTEILALANKMVGDFLKSPLAFKDGDIGRWEGARFVTYRTFTGAEQAMAFSAISVALATESPFKLVLMDEMNRIDGMNRMALICRMEELVERKEIDQFIGVDNTMSSIYERTQVTLIKL